MDSFLIGEKPCPRCGCYLTRKFKCGCGAIHSYYCVNCGRWTHLSPAEHVELTEIDARCDAGAAPHEHPESEKAARLDAFFAKTDRSETN